MQLHKDGQLNGKKITEKSSVKPRGLIYFLTSQKGSLKEMRLIREEGLFKKSNEEDIKDSFSNLLPHILWIQQTIHKSNST